MKHFFPTLLIISLFFTSCADKEQLRLPSIMENKDGQKTPVCKQVFPLGNWQFVHSIDFTMRDGSGSTVVGVTTLSKSGIKCALITIEGLTLFAARSSDENSLHIDRALSPFDNEQFAEGLMRDIRLIFQPPTGKESRGLVSEKSAVCRYEKNDGRVLDVWPDVDDCWQIKSYSPDLIMERSVIGQSCKEKNSSLIPEVLELKNFGHAGYTLKMTLISADSF